MKRLPFVALLTDFGEKDFFVASLKGVIAGICPSVQIIDITHQIPSFDVLSGSFVLYGAYRYFPSTTVFLAVVDPGVGSERKIIAVKTENYYFVAPDNGLLTLALQEENICSVRVLENKKYFLNRRGGFTFEARDKMAPVTAQICMGTPVSEFGPDIKGYNKLTGTKPSEKNGKIVGKILFVDKFGNCISNIPQSLLVSFRQKGALPKLEIKGKEIKNFKNNYSSARKGELFFLVGSLGLIENALCEESAASLLGVGPGDEVCLGDSGNKNAG